MTQDPRLTKATILIKQQRYAEAERSLREVLSTDPTDVNCLALLAEVKLRQDDHAAAESIIDQAIGLAPDTAYLYYIKGGILLGAKRQREAEVVLREAIELDPLDADAYALLAQILLSRKQYAEALEQADLALALDAEHLHALNMRSSVLVKLDRKEDSYRTIEGALREDPENPYTHTNYGWGLLETGDHRKALEHFGMALRRDPTSDYARAGMAQAVKAKNPVYRLYLQYAFFMNRLTANYQWGVIIGVYVLYRLLVGVSANYPALSPFVTPVLAVLVLFALSTWVIGPIGDLLLRLDRHGRYLLDADEKLTAEIVGGCVLVFLAGGLGYFITGSGAFVVLAGYGFTMILPVGLLSTESKTKNLLRYYGIGLGILGAVAVVAAFLITPFNLFAVGYAMALFGFQWVANFQVIRS
jgi:tetratricopeptide (TPR) repeat protein